jgi:hypothetical protein
MLLFGVTQPVPSISTERVTRATLLGAYGSCVNRHVIDAWNVSRRAPFDASVDFDAISCRNEPHENKTIPARFSL